MGLRSLFYISLATKCQMLFSVAVVVIIIAALLVPWVYMGSLVGELNANLAKQAALIVPSRYALHATDWADVQTDLDEFWPAISRELELAAPTPRLVYVGGCPQEVPADWDDFERDAVMQLCANPRKSQAQRTVHEPGRGPLTRYALAIRDPSQNDPRTAFLGIVTVTTRSEEIWSYTNLYQMVLVGAAFVAGLLAIVVFYLITQYLILSPVRDLRSVAERIVSGETSLRSEIETGDEFEELSDAFNDMLAHLNISQDELRKMNKSLDAKLGELAEINVSLFEADRIKGEFLANVSHELRTPLTSIVGFAELLRDATDSPKPSDPEKIKKFCSNILTSGRMLLDLINNLLDLAKIEAGKMSLHRTSFPIADICQAVIDFTRPLADKKNLAVHLHLPEDPPTMHSDAGKIQQIIYNLMSNAIKFTPHTGRINVRVQCSDGERVSITVQDTGPGIKEEAQEEIFEKFRQLDGSVTREYGGTGLGLAISRELSAMLGGRLHLRSEEGVGTEFIVDLPINGPVEAESSGAPLAEDQ
jgi:signal transduction histidine kinase